MNKYAIKLMKSELKVLASKIRFQKSIRKLNHPKRHEYIGQHQVNMLSHEYRMKHIAYCLERGTPAEKIEAGLSAESVLKYSEVQFWLKSMQEESTEKLYVVVDETLTNSQQAVQAGHAIAAYLLKHPFTQWQNGHLVLLRAKPGKGHLNKQPEIGIEFGVRYCHTTQCAEFREPDLGNKLTAYAAFGPNAQNAFKGYKLL